MDEESKPLPRYCPECEGSWIRPTSTYGGTWIGCSQCGHVVKVVERRGNWYIDAE